MRTWTAVALLLLPVWAGAESRGRVAVFSGGLEMVKVPVAVEDHGGRSVRDLNAEDFTLNESGKPQKIQLFARAFDTGTNENLTLDLAMLFDTSESMLEVLKLSQQAAVRFLASVPRARNVLVAFFDQDVRISSYKSEQQETLVKQIQNARSKGNTALRDAIATGLSRASGGPGRFAMVVFSDGEDTFSRISQAELMRLVHSSAVTIYPIMFTGKSINPDSAGQAKAFMRELAERTGGRIFAVTQAGDLPDIYRAIVEDLEGQYVLGFVSSDTRQDGAYRKLKVDVKRKDVRLRHREGYYAPTGQ